MRYNQDDTDSFILKANLIHKNKYDYSKTIYVKSQVKIIVICNKHGEFLISPHNHINGKCGCKKCYSEKPKKSQISKDATSIFISKAKEIHNEEYDYSKVNYKGVNYKVEIICPKHGSYFEYPGYHLKGKKCKICNLQLNKEKISKNFILKANQIHTNKYDYSLVEYKTARKKVKIICSKHGLFNQTPDNHLAGNGCPKCKSSLGENLIRYCLIEKNISFVEQKRFQNCRYKLPLVFDFYIPDCNICIEFDGKQHFEPIKWNSNKKPSKKDYQSFKLQQIKDNIKNNYCKDNNIKLLRISYLEIKDIQKILINFLSNN